MDFKVTIQNLKCGGCANTITKEIEKLDGVEAVVVNEDDSTVSFSNKTDDIGPVVERLRALGYPISDEENNLFTQAKSYVSCAVGRVTK